MPININPRFLPPAPGTGFTLPSQGQLVPLPQGGNFTTNFSRALVPYAPAGLPATIPTTAGVAGLGAEGAAATAAMGNAASGGGMFSSLGNIVTKYPLLSKLGVMSAAAAPLYLAPANDAPLDYQGIEIPNIPDNPEDTGIETLGKHVLRGTKVIPKAIWDTGYDLYQGAADLFRTKDERALRKLEETAPSKKGIEAPTTPIPSASLDFFPQESQMPQYVIPGAGASIPSTAAMDDLLKVLGGVKPEYQGLTDEVKNQYQMGQMLKALSAPADSKGAIFLNAYNAYNDAGTQLAQAEIRQKAEYVKNLQEWAKEYAKTAVDIEKQKNELAKQEDFKVHQTKGGFLVETSDDSGNKILQPISGEVFGNKKGSTVNIMGSKFNADTPLKEPLGILQNLNDIGALQPILKDNEKLFAEFNIGNTGDAKLDMQDKILNLAQGLLKNPERMAHYKQKYLDAVGVAPQGAIVTPAGQNLDWLSEITQGAR